MQQQYDWGIRVAGRSVEDADSIRHDVVDGCYGHRQQFRTLYRLAGTSLTHAYSLGTPSAKTKKAQLCV
jgi:hypothetical protein